MNARFVIELAHRAIAARKMADGVRTLDAVYRRLATSEQLTELDRKPGVPETGL